MSGRTIVLAIVCGLIAVANLGATCETCPPLDSFESDTFVITRIREVERGPDYEWLVGAEFDVDRDKETMTMRYSRDGTTYEVRYNLAPLN